jgi:hypothetical protein
MPRYLVISFDSDGYEFFHDQVIADDALVAAQFVLDRREGAWSAEALDADELRSKADSLDESTQDEIYQQMALLGDSVADDPDEPTPGASINAISL